MVSPAPLLASTGVLTLPYATPTLYCQVEATDLQPRQKCKQLVAFRKNTHIVYTNDKFLGLVDRFRFDIQCLLSVYT
jgi:hypothetical protein